VDRKKWIIIPNHHTTDRNKHQNILKEMPGPSSYVKHNIDGSNISVLAPD